MSEADVQFYDERIGELEAEIERLRAAADAAFFAMCAQRDSPDDEVFQDAIDALGVALSK
jgi:hypothetical protein